LKNTIFKNYLIFRSVCIEYVSGVVANRSSSEGHAVLSRYREALYALAIEVLTQSQFRRNQAKLEELDDELLDDNVSRVF
jgi:uncharacterized protein YjiS (DUF1127 family)